MEEEQATLKLPYALITLLLTLLTLLSIFSIVQCESDIPSDFLS